MPFCDLPHVSQFLHGHDGDEHLIHQPITEPLAYDGLKEPHAAEQPRCCTYASLQCRYIWIARYKSYNPLLFPRPWMAHIVLMIKYRPVPVKHTSTTTRLVYAQSEARPPRLTITYMFNDRDGPITAQYV